MCYFEWRFVSVIVQSEQQNRSTFKFLRHVTQNTQHEQCVVSVVSLLVDLFTWR